MKTVTLALAATSAFLLASCRDAGESADVAFAKTTFESLVRGDSSVVADIDWETFNSLGVPVGPQYLAIPTEPEKERFKTGFVTQFSASFRNSGGSSESFSNWRATSHDQNHTVVTADSTEGSLKLTVSERDSKRRISAMEIEKQGS